MRRFRVDVGTIITVLVLTESLLLLGLGYWVSERLVSEIGASAHQADHARIEDKTLAYLNKAASVVHALGESPSLQANGPRAGNTGELLWTLLQQSPEVDGLYVADTNGHMLMVTRHPSPALRHIDVDADGTTETWEFKAAPSAPGDAQGSFRTHRIEAFRSQYDPARRSWYQAADANDGAPSWGVPYVFDASRLLGVTYAVPAQRRDALGQPQSLIAAGDVTLARLSEFVRQFSRGGYGDSALLSAQQQVLARSDQEGEVHTLLPAQGGVLAAIQAHLRQVDTAAASSAAPNDAIDFALIHADERYLVRASRLSLTGWQLVSWVPEEQILGGLRHTVLWSITLVLVFLGLILLLSLRLSNVITAPVEKLSRIARRIGRFDLLNLPRVPSRVLEIQHLDQALDDSARGLQAFAKFVPVDVLNQLVDAGHALSPNGAPRHLTVMFTDIAGFTRISESMEAQPLVDQLGDYFNVAARIFAAHGGTIDKFMGDGIMVLWGAPTALPDAEHQACLAALALQAELSELNAQWQARGLPRFITRIGIHSGIAVVGVLGSQDRLAYTAFGDAVNVASRIESMNKELGTRMLLSEATQQALRGRLPTRRIDEAIALRGREGRLVLYELLEPETGPS